MPLKVGVVKVDGRAEDHLVRPVQLIPENATTAHSLHSHRSAKKRGRETWRGKYKETKQTPPTKAAATTALPSRWCRVPWAVDCICYLFTFDIRRHTKQQPGQPSSRAPRRFLRGRHSREVDQGDQAWCGSSPLSASFRKPSDKSENKQALPRQTSRQREQLAL